MAKEKILIVEDERALIKAYSEHFTSEGYDVEVAYDGEEGLAKVRSLKPDLVLLDIIMPKKDGMEVLREMKSNPAMKTIPVMILTNLETSKGISEAVGVGSVQYLVKANYSLEQLSARVKEVLHVMKSDEK